MHTRVQRWILLKQNHKMKPPSDSSKVGFEVLSLEPNNRQLFHKKSEIIDCLQDCNKNLL
jgi:hypothetical protein